MLRWVVWINGVPLLLGQGVEPTEWNVNAARAQMFLKPLNEHDEVNGVSVIQMRDAARELTTKYPERTT